MFVKESRHGWRDKVCWFGGLWWWALVGFWQLLLLCFCKKNACLGRSAFKSWFVCCLFKRFEVNWKIPKPHLICLLYIGIYQLVFSMAMAKSFVSYINCWKMIDDESGVLMMKGIHCLRCGLGLSRINYVVVRVLHFLCNSPKKLLMF